MRLQRLIAVLAVAAASVPGSGAAEETARVALLPIAVHSADIEPGYLSAGLAEMLASRLEQDGGISVIRLGSDAVATNARVALDLGRPSGADFVLYGSFTQFGEGASLDVRVLPTNGSRPEGERRIFIQSGTVAEIIPQLSVLAEKVKRYVKNDESSEPVPASVSVGPSPPAFDPDYESMLRRIDALEKSLYERVAKEAEQAAAEDEEVAEADPDPFNTGVPLR